MMARTATVESGKAMAAMVASSVASAAQMHLVMEGLELVT